MSVIAAAWLGRIRGVQAGNFSPDQGVGAGADPVCPSPQLGVYWSRSKPNFGDWLSPLVCEALSGRRIVFAALPHCDLVAIGSLLQRLKEGFFGRPLHVWGTGFIEPVKPHRSKHHYHALRGKLTEQMITNVKDVALGDPGLLAHLLLADTERPAKECRVGIVCHYKDKGHSQVEALVRECPHVRELDIFAPPRQLLRAMAGCEVILSSAMHPLIAADALGIPNAWIKLSDEVRGGGFKYRDYYSVFGLTDVQPLVLDRALIDGWGRIVETYRRPGLPRIQEDLIRAFPFLKAGFHG